MPANPVHRRVGHGRGAWRAGRNGTALQPQQDKYHDVGLNAHIENAAHALAIDERRKPFAPTMWTGPPDWKGQLVQAWFPGVHSNVGGGYTPDGLANELLHWLVEQAERLGLALDSEYLRHFTPCFNSTLHDSMSVMYRIMGPHVRAVAASAVDGEAIHQSTLDRMNHAPCPYQPGNVAARQPHANALPSVDTTSVARGAPCR